MDIIQTISKFKSKNNEMIYTLTKFNNLSINILLIKRNFTYKSNIKTEELKSFGKSFKLDQNNYFSKLIKIFKDEDIEEGIEIDFQDNFFDLYSNHNLFARFELKATDFFDTIEEFLNFSFQLKNKIDLQIKNEQILKMKCLTLINAKQDRIVQLYDILEDQLDMHNCKCREAIKNKKSSDLNKKSLSLNDNAKKETISKEDLKVFKPEKSGTSKNLKFNLGLEQDKIILLDKKKETEIKEPVKIVQENTTCENNDDLDFSITQFMENM